MELTECADIREIAIVDNHVLLLIVKKSVLSGMLERVCPVRADISVYVRSLHFDIIFIIVLSRNLSSDVLEMC